jgi:hypothetical protein
LGGARAALERARGARRAAQVVVEHAGRRILHDVERSAHGIRGDRHAAGHRLEHHEAEGATTTFAAGAWKRRIQAYVHASGTPVRTWTYSGKHVWYAVVKRGPRFRQ